MAVKNGTSEGETLTGTSVADTLRGLGGDDLLLGLDGNDKHFGGAGFDLILGAAGNDTMYGGTGNDSLVGGAGNDTGFSDEGNDQLQGGAGKDRLHGGIGNDELFGGADKDELFGGDGADKLDGGAGDDIVSYLHEAGTKNVTVNLATGKATDTFGRVDTLKSVEAAVGSDRFDTLIGSAGLNALFGGDGGDILIGGNGADLLDGEAGFDTVDYSRETGTKGVVVNLVHEGDDNYGAAKDTFGKNDRLVSIESVIGTKRADTITGDGKQNTLQGLAGNDTLNGGVSKDFLYGGAGKDTLIAGAGEDTLYGEDGNDTIYTNHGKVFVDRNGFDPFDDAYAHGGAGNDIIYRYDGQAKVFGGDGFDTVFTSADFLRLGDSNAIEKVVGIGNADIWISNVGDDPCDITGNSGNNVIRGSVAGGDTLRGGASADELYGSGGADELYGDQGDDDVDLGFADTGNDHVHATVGMGTDTVGNFQIGHDKLADVSNGVVSGGNGSTLTITHLTGTFIMAGIEWTQIDTNGDFNVDSIEIKDADFTTDHIIQAGLGPPDVSLFIA